MRQILLISALFTFISSGRPFSADFDGIAQWRGPSRDGVYRETGLLKEWPSGGPELLWAFEGLGSGQGSPVMAGNSIFVTGITDTLSGEGYIYKFDLQGNLVWKKNYGKDWIGIYPGARSTPTVVDGRVYLESGNGAVICLDSESGDILWTVDFFKDLGADSVQFGFSESLLIYGDQLICTPGGKVNNVVGMNRFTGEKLWSSPAFGEQATYSSPIVVQHNGKELYINLTASSVIGVDISNGDMYWRLHQYQDNKIHANTPVYHEGKVIISSASRKDSSGLVLLQLSHDAKQAEIAWRNREMINLSGGVILKDGYIYGSAYLQPRWYCIDFITGETKYVSRDIGGGAIILADGLFYCYTERDGEIALVEATPDTFRVISKFNVPLGSGEHWAHPVIGNGMLLVRHGESIMAFDIRG
jgi:outer membrane protein assembly factor BamB